MNVIVTPDELRDMSECRASGSRALKKDWWRRIRAKYELPLDDKLKVDLDTGVIKYKHTSEKVQQDPAAVAEVDESWAVNSRRPTPQHVELRGYGFIDSDDGSIVVYTGDGALQAIFDHEERLGEEPIRSVQVCSAPTN